ncbi:DUF1403 family protein [Agrobacterium tumefaciens]|uniref:DUF1403 family protein n=1 Tax=Agrobacterium tumefaciens TaxID=358 RepID=UPI0032AF00A8
MTTARPDAEVLALGLTEAVLAHKLNWPRSVPLLLPERFGPALGTPDFTSKRTFRRFQIIENDATCG